jgi:nitroreductase
VDLDLLNTLRSTGAVRAYTDEPVSDATLARVLDTARFAPNGGNRQGWRVIVVKDQEARTALRDLYLSGWYDYLALGAAGMTPWSPLSDRDQEAVAVANAAQFAEAGAAAPGFAEKLDTAPALLLVLADLGVLATVDRDLPRYTMVGGASIYPFVWNLLLAARAEGLGGVMTTVAIRREAELRALFDIPETVIAAALVVLGHPVAAARRLKRDPVSSFAWIDRYGGVPLQGEEPAGPPTTRRRRAQMGHGTERPG